MWGSGGGARCRCEGAGGEAGGKKKSHVAGKEVSLQGGGVSERGWEEEEERKRAREGGRQPVWLPAGLCTIPLRRKDCSQKVSNLCCHKLAAHTRRT